MKKSYANCEICPLRLSTGKVCETNSEKNLVDIDEMYIASPHDWSMIKSYNESRKVRYFIVSPIICNPIDDWAELKTESICKDNALTFIKKCNPKKIIMIGQYLDELKKDIPKFEYYEFITDLTKPIVNKDDEKMFEDLTADLSAMKDKPVIIKSEKEPSREIVDIVANDNVYMFTIPEKYYTDEYRLVDVQHMAKEHRVIYIFRDKNNKKEFYEFPLKTNDFYWYESLSGDSKIIESYNNLTLKVGNYKDRNLTPKGYGGDINLTTLHSADYFLQNKAEAPTINENIFFFDIEVYTFKNRVFPDPVNASFPINAVSFRTSEPDSHTRMFLLKLGGEIDERIDEIVKSGKYKELNIFTDEYSLIMAFLGEVKKYQPDFIAGWNSNGFDIPYIIGRMKKLGIGMKELSPYGNVYADGKGKVICTGLVALDQLELFKGDTTRGAQPSYKLGSIAELILKKTKVAYEGNLNQLYSDDIDTFINYSLTDTNLLYEIESVVHHIKIQDELRRITTTSHSGANSTLGQAEGLFLTSMKKKGLVARNKGHDVEKEDLIGAYVMDAKGGLFEGILIDFDFASLYPSIINSGNIGPDTLIGKIGENDAFSYIYQKEKLKTIKIVKDPIHNSNEETITKEEFDKFISDNMATINISGCVFCGHSKYTSIFNTVITMLFSGRKLYKKKMLDAKESGNKNEYISNHGKQMAFKILANSLYGALGNEHFKFYNINLAKSITMTGRELLKYSAVHVDDYLVKRGKVKDFKMIIDFESKMNSLTDVLYGDTDSIFCTITQFLKDKKIEVKKSPEVLNEIQKIQDYVNNTALDAFLKVHNIDKKYSMIFLKNEYVFSKYYTLNGKKHYALKIIGNEGRDVTETEIKGIEVKRSEIPQRSRKMLIEILDVILSEIPKDQIIDKINAIKIKSKKEMLELIDKRDNSIVRTVSYSKPRTEYKALPQHIKAMECWNEIVSDDFRFGTKGKLWVIKGFDENKAPDHIKKNYHTKFLKKYQPSDLTAICLPEEVSVLPDYFVPDVKSIISYCCDERIANLTEPLYQESNSMLTF